MSDVRHILFITSSRIGDAVLSSGLLSYIEQNYPSAKVTIACGPLVVSLFEGFPNLEQIIAVRKKKWNLHWVELWNKVVGTRWDLIVDLRDSLMPRFLRAGELHRFGRHISKELHKVQQNAAVLDLDEVPDPKLWFTGAQKQKAKELIPDGGFVLGVGPTANWAGKTWPEDRFIEIIRFLTGKGQMMSGARVAVFAAPGEEEPARRVLASIPMGRAIDVIAKTSPGDAAATLARCNFYLGNDSGLMHCAAASGVPTMGLFGPSYPHIYAPWGSHTDYVRTPQSYKELIDFDGYNSRSCGSLMTTLSVDAVKEKLTEFCELHQISA